MSNILVTTNQNVIDVTTTSGITVTTPLGQTIDVTVSNSTVNVTNTTDEITVLTNGQLTYNITADNTDQIPEGTTNLYFTTARAQASITNGTGVTINNGVVSIGQSVATAANPTFNSIKLTAGTGALKRSDGSTLLNANSGTDSLGNVYKDVGLGGAGLTAGYINIDSRILLNSAALTTTTTDPNQLLDKFDKNTYRAANYLIHIGSNGEYQIWEGMIIHNGTTAVLNAYGDLRTTANNLATITASINENIVEIRCTPVNAVTTFKIQKTLMNV